jgi:hypothetical protein
VITLDHHLPLPLDVSEITPEWLSSALGAEITKSDVSKTMAGTATKYLFDVVYADPAAAEALKLPASICVKGGFDANMRALGLNSAYRREAEFFSYIAPELHARNFLIPRALHCSTDNINGQGIVIFENLHAANYKFGEITEPWSKELVAGGLEQLAGLHALTWGKTSADYPWIGDGNILKTIAESLFSPEYWQQQFYTDFRPAGVPENILDRERMYEAFKKMWRTENPKFTCMTHGDGHLGNTYISPEGLPGLIDFQAPSIGSAIDDLSYFIGGALTVADRRAHEKELVQSYLDSLHKHGGPKLTIEDVWFDYQKQHVHGFVWAMTAPMMQTKARVDAMTERYLAAMIDHDSVRLVEEFKE